MEEDGIAVDGKQGEQPGQAGQHQHHQCCLQPRAGGGTTVSAPQGVGGAVLHTGPSASCAPCPSCVPVPAHSPRALLLEALGGGTGRPGCQHEEEDTDLWSRE